MAAPIKTGKVHSPALVAVTYTLDARRLPTLELGLAGTPTFEIAVLTRDALGRDVPSTFLVGPDNVPESSSALRLWEAIGLAWQGKLGR